MTPPRSASPPKLPKPQTGNDLTRVKQNFIAAAHAASPLRAVEKYPWTAVTATAAATMAATVVVSFPVFGKASGGLLTTGLALAGSILQAKLTPSVVNVQATPTAPPPTDK